MHKALAVLSILVGMAFGVGLYTFNYAHGWSYFSNDPQACANCHIMDDHYSSWTSSSHHNWATCNDCHTPHTLVPKYLTKAENGFNHSLKFTLQNFKYPIQIREVNRQRLLHNCQECHAEFISGITAHTVPDGEEFDCLRCHPSVGHGPRN